MSDPFQPNDPPPDVQPPIPANRAAEMLRDMVDILPIQLDEMAEMLSQKDLNTLKAAIERVKNGQPLDDIQTFQQAAARLEEGVVANSIEGMRAEIETLREMVERAMPKP